ncbi:MAG: hypothetical protein H7A01_09200 [Hahellaceae bacterium]|nr:hypothetical protein [Hahellaceae bacterium]MCP5211350.1 hypothetical protein [Hahellaceae bacterium]
MLKIPALALALPQTSKLNVKRQRMNADFVQTGVAEIRQWRLIAGIAEIAAD